MSDVFIVESDETARAVLVETLDTDGLRPDSTSFADDCRQLIANNGPPDAFVIDAVLPREDGIAFGRELAEAYRGTVGVLLVNCGRRVGVDSSRRGTGGRPGESLPGVETFRSIDPLRIADRVSDYR